MFTGVNDLRDAGVRRDEQNQVIERYGADEVQSEPRLQIMHGNLARLEDDFVGEIVRYYP